MKSTEESNARPGLSNVHTQLQSQISQLSESEIEALLGILPILVNTQTALIEVFKVLVQKDLEQPMRETIQQLGKTAAMIPDIGTAKRSKVRRKLRRTAEEIARCEDQMRSMGTYLNLVQRIRRTTSSSPSESPSDSPSNSSEKPTDSDSRIILLNK